MKPIELLKLAEQADREGRYAIADKLTIRATRIAAGPPIADIAAAAGRAGLEAAEKEGATAAEALLRSRLPGGAGHVNVSPTNTSGGIIHSPQSMVEKIGQEAEQELVQTVVNAPKPKRIEYVILKDGTKVPTAGQKPEYLESLREQLNPDQLKKLEGILSRRGKQPAGFKTKQEAKIEQKAGTGGGESQTQYAPTTTTSTTTQSGSPFNAGPNSKVFNASENSTINMGVSNAAFLGGMGIVGVAGALGALGMYLGRDGIVRDRDNVVVAPQDIPANIAQRLPRYQMMTRREEAGQLGGQRALDAQNFVDANASNPRVKNQRDWYNLALQTSGGDKNFANNVITYVKASPEMSSQVGGGSNI
jgi:hypothetical protein